MPDKKNDIPQLDILGKSSFLIKVINPFIDRTALDEKPHKHNFQEIIFIKSGEGKHLIDDKVYHLEPGTFYLIGKGQVHEFIEGRNLKGFLIRFLDNFIPPSTINTNDALNSTLLGSIVSTNKLNIPSPEIKYYEDILAILHYEFNDNELDYSKTKIIQHLLLALLSKLERRLRSLSKEKIVKTVDTDTKMYHSFLLLIEENYKKFHEINFYVSRLRVNKRKLAFICKTFSQKTPKQILNERLMVEAKRLLLYTAQSSKEIAFELGYDDPAYFSRFFKKYNGLSPRAFKESKQ